MLTNEEFQALLAKIKADPKSVTPAEFKTYMRCLRGDAYYDDPDIPFVNLTRLDTLREKAVNDRASITDEEKLFILGWPSRQEIVVNVSRATRSEYTPSQLLEKAVSDPESLKLWEASILVDKFHYRTAVDWDAIPKLLAVKRQEREAQHRAEQAVLTETEKMAMGNAHRLLRQLHEVSRGASDGVKPDPISREAVEATRSLDRYERMWKEADDEARRETLKSPTPWVQWIKDEGEPWGFALFRSEDAKGRAEYDRVYEDSIAFGLTSILGGSEILESKVLQVVETSCRDGDHAALREYGHLPCTISSCTDVNTGHSKLSEQQVSNPVSCSLPSYSQPRSRCRLSPSQIQRICNPGFGCTIRIGKAATTMMRSRSIKEGSMRGHMMGV